MTVSACRFDAPRAGTARHSDHDTPTISGTVRGAGGASTLADRLVEVVNLETGERQRTTTGRTGGFSFRVRPARYRVEVALNGGESLIRRPGDIDLSRSAVNAHADFVVGTGHASHPRHPHYPGDSGLGQPIA